MKVMTLNEELNIIKINELQTTAFGMSLVSMQNNNEITSKDSTLSSSSTSSLMRKNLQDLDNLTQLNTQQKMQLLKGMIVRVENSIRDEQKTLWLLRKNNRNNASNYCGNGENSQTNNCSKNNSDSQSIMICLSHSDRVNQKPMANRETMQQESLPQQQLDRTQAEPGTLKIQNNTQFIKTQQEEIVMNNLKAIKALEQELIKAKAERNNVSENLEDVKYELIDSKAQLSAYNAELAKQDFMIQNLQVFITQLTKKGISSIGNYNNNRNNLNISRMDASSVMNSSVIVDVKQSLSSLKTFLQNAYSKIVQQQQSSTSSSSHTSSTRLDQHSMSQPQQPKPPNSNNILSGIDLQ